MDFKRNREFRIIRVSGGFLTVLLVSLVLTGDSLAQAQDGFGFDTLNDGFGRWQETVGQSIDALMEEPAVTDFYNMLWGAFSVFLLIPLISRYIFVGLDIEDLAGTLLLIAIVRVLLDNYSPLADVFWATSDGLASSIQLVLIGKSDLMALSKYVYELFSNVFLDPVSIVMDSLPLVLASALFNLVSFGLSILTAVATIWALWGFALAKIIGFIFIPFLLINRLSFLFDGWLRFFLSFLVYNIIARADLALIAVGLQAVFAQDALVTNEFLSINTFDNIFDLFGLFFFLLIGILSIFSIAQFSASVVGGTTGIGTSVRTLAFSAAASMRAFR